MCAAPGGAEFDPEACIHLLDLNEVTTHFLIDRSGTLWQLADEINRAWHAGVSRMPAPMSSRENVNDFSIGAELVGSPESGFTEQQYTALAELIAELSARFPLKFIVGHDQIAPERKQDPGSNFDWPKLKTLLDRHGLTALQYAPPFPV